jgi:hypothetical protein
MKRTHPGRPPLDDTCASVDVHLRMPSKQYDETFRRAGKARVTMPEQIRQDMRDAARRAKE